MTRITIDTIDPDAIEAHYYTAPTPIGPRLACMLAAARAYDSADSDQDSAAAEAAYQAAKTELMASDELLPWACSEEGHQYRVVLAASAEDALDEIHDDIGDYDTTDATVWVEHRVDSMVHDETASETITINPDEPDCLSGHAHDWQSPYEVVGGIKENPGVWGHHGGVVIKEVCRHCGAYRITDTWAQDKSTGEQGLRSIAYRMPDDAALAYASHDEAVVRLVEEAGYSPREIDDGWIVPIECDGGNDAESEAARDVIAAALPDGWCADWTGNGTGDAMDLHIHRE